MKSFILLGSSRSIAVAVLQAIKSFSDAPCFVIGDNDTVALRWSGLCKRHCLFDFSSGEHGQLERLVNTLAEMTPQATLIPFDCDAVRTVNQIKSRLHVRIAPIPESATLEMLHNKWSFYGFCLRNGLEVPLTLSVGAKHQLDFEALTAELGLPFVLKPTDCSGSEGMRIVKSRTQFEQEILYHPDYNYPQLIAQLFVDGTDIDLSLLSLRGELACLAVQQARGPHIHFLPNTYLEGIATTLCRYSAYHGVMHIDARIDKKTQKVFLIECNPRFWASLTASSWCGQNFIGKSVDPALRAAGSPRLVSGSAPRRHPLLRPSSWKLLLFDRGCRGRLLRAELFDLYVLSQFLGQLPAMAGRAVWRCMPAFKQRRQQKLPNPAYPDARRAACNVTPYRYSPETLSAPSLPWAGH